MSSESATTEILSPAKEQEMVYRDRLNRALAMRDQSQQTMKDMLDAIGANDRSNWFADKFHSSIEMAEKQGQPNVVLTGLNQYVGWLDKAEKSGDRDLSREDRRELQQRLPVLLERAAKEDPEEFRKLMQRAGVVDASEPSLADEFASEFDSDLVDTTQTEGC